MIPPIGRDSIVAFRYQRTEPPKPGSEIVPANLIAPRTAFNLVSSLESVEAVTAADQAAGGARLSQMIVCSGLGFLDSAIAIVR